LQRAEELETSAHLRPGIPVGGPDSHAWTLAGASWLGRVMEARKHTARGRKRSDDSRHRKSTRL